MSPDLAGLLAAYGIIFDGDPVLGTWSIGGPTPANPLTDAILGQAQGISWSRKCHQVHQKVRQANLITDNIYEGDSSIARFDAYLNVRGPRIHDMAYR